MIRLSFFVRIAPIFVLTGCASVTSAVHPKVGDSDGLAYYMPMRDIIVTFTVTNKDTLPAVSVDAGDAYPDLSQRYVLRRGSGLISTDTLDVEVGEDGLLSSSKAKSDSQFGEILKSAVNSAVKVGAKSVNEPPSASCTSVGVYKYAFPAPSYKSPKPASPCGYKLTIEKLGAWGDGQAVTESDGSASNRTHNIKAESSASGYFYRQNEPYRVTLERGDHRYQNIVLSPSLSPVSFLPVKRYLFANVDTDFSFAKGVPTKYKQVSYSEVASLASLPASVVDAYFSAVGGLFDAFKSNDAKEVDDLKGQMALLLAQRKFEKCLAAYKAEDQATIDSLHCGQ